MCELCIPIYYLVWNHEKQFCIIHEKRINHIFVDNEKKI